MNKNESYNKEQEAIIERINTKLSLIGAGLYDTQRPSAQKRLLDVETYVSQQDDLLNDAKEKLKSSSYTVKSVAAAVKCSRTTLYTDPVMQAYIEKSIEISDSNNPAKRMESLKEEISDLKEKVALMEARDVKELLLKQQVAELESQLTAAHKSLEKMQLKLAASHIEKSVC